MNGEARGVWVELGATAILPEAWTTRQAEMPRGWYTPEVWRKLLTVRESRR